MKRKLIRGTVINFLVLFLHRKKMMVQQILVRMRKHQPLSLLVILSSLKVLLQKLQIPLTSKGKLRLKIWAILCTPKPAKIGLWIIIMKQWKMILQLFGLGEHTWISSKVLRTSPSITTWYWDLTCTGFVLEILLYSTTRQLLNFREWRSFALGFVPFTGKPQE